MQTFGFPLLLLLFQLKTSIKLLICYSDRELESALGAVNITLPMAMCSQSTHCQGQASKHPYTITHYNISRKENAPSQFI